MRIGITGLSKSGKTTIFNAITKLKAEINTYDVKAEPNIGTVLVDDERITNLSAIYKPQKTIYAHVEFLDFPGLQERTGNNELLPASSIALLRTVDAIAIVLRNFSDTILDETLGSKNPIKDVENIIAEFMLSDLMVIEKRLEKIELNYKRGVKSADILIEEKALRRALENLNNEIPLKEVNFPDEELKAIKGFHFLSQKPQMIILNSDENNFGRSIDVLSALESQYSVHEFAGKYEMELSEIDEEYAKELMEDLNLFESAVLRAIKGAYSLLGCITFITIGGDEVRAWTIQKGDTAIMAAGKIHSDMARGFIRAETYSYNDIIQYNNEKTLREKGLYRLEGKNYIVQDGDIIYIRFNV